MNDKPIVNQIDDMIKSHSGWKGELLAELRTAILESDAKIIEEVKWRMAARPEGWPVWSHNGIVCFAEIWKDNVKLLFPKGAYLKDPQKLFNARLQSKDIRAIELKQGDKVNGVAIMELVRKAVELNSPQL